MSECTLLIISPMNEDPLLLVGVGGLENLAIKSFMEALPLGVSTSRDGGEEHLRGDIEGDREPPSPAMPRERAEAFAPWIEELVELVECLR